MKRGAKAGNITRKKVLTKQKEYDKISEFAARAEDKAKYSEAVDKKGSYRNCNREDWTLKIKQRKARKGPLKEEDFEKDLGTVRRN